MIELDKETFRLLKGRQTFNSLMSKQLLGRWQESEWTKSKGRRNLYNNGKGLCLGSRHLQKITLEIVKRDENIWSLEKFNTLFSRQNSCNEVIGGDQHFFGISLSKLPGIGRGLLWVRTSQCHAYCWKRSESQPREPQALQGHFGISVHLTKKKVSESSQYGLMMGQPCLWNLIAVMMKYRHLCKSKEQRLSFLILLTWSPSMSFFPG